jgi:hypothetical protein
MRNIRLLYAMRLFHRALAQVEQGRPEEGLRLSQRSAELAAGELVHPHLLMCRIFAESGNMLLALVQREEALEATSRRYNGQTYSYVNLYTYALLSEVIQNDPMRLASLPDPQSVDMTAVARSVRRRFPMRIGSSEAAWAV